MLGEIDVILLSRAKNKLNAGVFAEFGDAIKNDRFAYRICVIQARLSVNA